MAENVQIQESPAAEAAVQNPTMRESDNTIMKAALLLRSAIASAPSVSRGLWRYYGKQRLARLARFVKETPPHPVLYLAVALAVFGGINFAQTHQLATGVTVNGEYIGAVKDMSVFQHARSFVQSAASSALGYDYSFENESLTTSPVVAATNDLISEETLVNEICGANDAVAYTYVLKIIGQTVGIAGSEDAIEFALKSKLDSYTNENTISAEFSENIFIGKEIISSDEQSSFVSIDDVVNATSQEEVIYTIQAGDTWSQIAARYEMSSSELLALNPGFDIDKIWEGQELTVSAAVPLLSVKTVERVQYQAPVAYETEYVDDSTMYQGESRVITKGVEGLANVDAHVSYTDGIETARDVISSETITAPVTQVVAKGTKERPKTMASGTFSWPASGRLTSTFGGRKSPGGIGSTNHKGIDIANARGTAIKASDGGTVTYAGWMSGYGYLVIIDHGNGYQTYYGHNSKLLVNVGTKVYKGQQIAKMGSTGNSTGNHCHFEIRLYGTPVNPLKYLP